MDIAKPNQAPASGHIEISSPGGYSWYVVFILMLCYALSFVDRQIINLLVEPIKADLDISDTQFSLLQGFAFVVFYTAMGLYIARLTDRHNRRNIIFYGVVLWSFMTMLCGFTRNFFQLFLARIGVGVGEATLSPAAYSIISDYFPKPLLGRAMSVYTMGVFLGSGLAFVIGGFLIKIIPANVDLLFLGSFKAWQFVFVLVGLPGLLLALFVLTIREPVRGGLGGDNKHDPTSVPQVSDKAFVYFWENRRFYLPHAVGFSCLTLVGTAFHAWSPAFYMRVFDLEASSVGLIYGSITICFAIVGVLVGGWLGDVFVRRNIRAAFLRVPLWGAAFLTVPATMATLMPSSSLSYVAMAVFQFFASFHAGLAVASLHTVTPAQFRAQATALYLLSINFIGLGFGPLVVALITDNVFGDEEAVGKSLAIVGFLSCVCAIIFLKFAIRKYEDLRAKMEVVLN